MNEGWKVNMTTLINKLPSINIFRQTLWTRIPLYACYCMHLCRGCVNPADFVRPCSKISAIYIHNKSKQHEIQISRQLWETVYCEDRILYKASVQRAAVLCLCCFELYLHLMTRMQLTAQPTCIKKLQNFHMQLLAIKLKSSLNTSLAVAFPHNGILQENIFKLHQRTLTQCSQNCIKSNGM